MSSSRSGKNTFRLHWVLAFLFIISCAPQVFGFSKNRSAFSDKFIAVHTLQNDRNTSGITKYFADDDPEIRLIAYEAMASIQDTIYLDSLMTGFSDSDANVRIAAAYALRQTAGKMMSPDPTLELKIIGLIASEKEPKVTRELFVSLGMITRNPETAFLSNYRTSDPLILEGIAWGIYRAGLNGVADDKLTKRAFDLLRPEIPESARLGVSHFFARTKELSIDDFADDFLQMTSTEPNPDIRMALTLALGKIKNAGSLALLSSLIETDPDVRVRINAVRSLGKIGGLKAEMAIRSVLQDKNINVSIAAAESFKNAEQIFFPGEILKTADTTAPWRVRTVLYESLLKQNFETQSVSHKLRSHYRNTENVYEKAWTLEALAMVPENISFIRDEIFNSDVPVIRTYGMSGLSTLLQQGNLDDSFETQLINVMKDGIESDDAVMISLAAGTLAAPELHMKDSIRDTKFLYDALQRLTLPQDQDAAVEIVHAIEYFDNSKFEKDIINQKYHPIDWSILRQLSSKPVAVIHTNQGPIKIELFKYDAPGTVAYFAQLTRNGFYNGKYFHRVVPNFVIQAGCPRGDGWGSTDAIIRSEFSRISYGTGYLGMASSGKDTESCQWFITQSPTPHLDGKYTIFGRVLEGMDVVNQIQVGDIIQSIQIR